MKISVVTLFPDMFTSVMESSIVGRALREKFAEIEYIDIRTCGIGRYRQVDDSPYGGGAGMLLKPDVVTKALNAVSGTRASQYRIFLAPSGVRLRQPLVEKLAKKEHLVFLCGHYEGIDERVIEAGHIDQVISIGDFVLTGGELGAMVLIDAVLRQIPGVLGSEHSALDESFSKKLQRKREYPQYTRPETFEGLTVPPVLLSGNHAKIEEWRNSHLR